MKEKKKVLMIDDDDINNYIAEEWVKTTYPDQVELTTFADAEEAIQFLKSCSDQHFPDLIMCDLKMPAVDGFEFIEWYENTFYHQHQDTKIFILTSSIRKDDAKKAKSYESVADFISKLSVQDNFKRILRYYQ